MPENVENTEKTIEFYKHTKDSITIENIVKMEKISFDEYKKIDADIQYKGDFIHTFYAPKEFEFIDKNKLNVRLELFCVASENGENVPYYKFIKATC